MTRPIDVSVRHCTSQRREAAHGSKARRRKRELLADRALIGNLVVVGVAIAAVSTVVAVDQGRPVFANAPAPGPGRASAARPITEVSLDTHRQRQRQRGDQTKPATTGHNMANVGGVKNASSTTRVANSGCSKAYAIFWGQIVVHSGRSLRTRSESRDAAGQ